MVYIILGHWWSKLWYPVFSSLCITGYSRWLELRSLAVLDLSKYNCGPISFLYITKKIYSWSLELPISRSSQSLKLSHRSRYRHFIVFHSQSHQVLIAYTRSPIKRVINTHWASRYLDNGGQGGKTWTC